MLGEPYADLDILALVGVDVRLEPVQRAANLGGDIRNGQPERGCPRLEVHLHLALPTGIVIGDVVDALIVSEQAPDGGDGLFEVRLVRTGDDDRDVRSGEAALNLKEPQSFDIVDDPDAVANGGDDLGRFSLALVIVNRRQFHPKLREMSAGTAVPARVQVDARADQRRDGLHFRLGPGGGFDALHDLVGALDRRAHRHPQIDDDGFGIGFSDERELGAAAFHHTYGDR